MTETLSPTAAALGLEAVADDAFRETDATWLPTEEFTPTVARLLAAPTRSSAAGWETSSEAAGRFLAGMERLARTHADGTVAICSGGRALTSVLVSIGAVDADRAVQCWEHIAMPDVAVIDLNPTGAAHVVQHFGGGD